MSGSTAAELDEAGANGPPPGRGFTRHGKTFVYAHVLGRVMLCEVVKPKAERKVIKPKGRK
jgi:hypothetical protein